MSQWPKVNGWLRCRCLKWWHELPWKCHKIANIVNADLQIWNKHKISHKTSNMLKNTRLMTFFLFFQSNFFWNSHSIIAIPYTLLDSGFYAIIFQAFWYRSWYHGISWYIQNHKFKMTFSKTANFIVINNWKNFVFFIKNDILMTITSFLVMNRKLR